MKTSWTAPLLVELSLEETMSGPFPYPTELSPDFYPMS
jgi:hypothetical protein